MKTLLILISLAALAHVTGCTSVRPVGHVNGLDVTRVTSRGVFSPSSTTIVLSDPTHPGTIESIDSAHGPGFIPAVAQASGIAAGAALLRPSSVKQSGGGATSTSGAASNAGAVGGSGSTTQNGSVHHNEGNGNGSGNNGNH